MELINMILSIVGILVSGCGLYYAIIQVKGLQEITEQYQEQVKQEVSTAQQKIRNGLLISEVTLCIKNLENAIKYVQGGELELAIMRMEDVETTLYNEDLFDVYLNFKQKFKYKEAIEDYKDSLRSIIKNANDKKNINTNFIIDSLSNMRELLSIVDNNIKSSLYEKGN